MQMLTHMPQAKAWEHANPCEWTRQVARCVCWLLHLRALWRNMNHSLPIVVPIPITLTDCCMVLTKVPHPPPDFVHGLVRVALSAR
jgi:hypothetical protein